MTVEPLIRLRGITREFVVPASVMAVDGLDLDIGDGDHIAITGPSGSGKSTLLNLLGLLDRPDDGSHTIGGVDVAALPSPTLARIRASWIGFVFQQFHLVPHRSAIENVQMGLLYQGLPRAARLAQALRVLEEVGLAHRASATPRTLSGGEQQRVAIARAIVGSRRLILCDEPTGNLDSENTSRILDLLDRIRGAGRTIVVVTHDDHVAARSKRHLRMRDGKFEVQDDQ